MLVSCQTLALIGRMHLLAVFWCGKFLPNRSGRNGRNRFLPGQPKLVSAKAITAPWQKLPTLVEFSYHHVIPMTLYEDIMPYFDKFIHVYGWNVSILCSPLKIWAPKNFTIANFRQPVSKSWLRPWVTRWFKLISMSTHFLGTSKLFFKCLDLLRWWSPTEIAYTTI